MKFKVGIPILYYYPIEVEAADEEEAEQKAWDEFYTRKEASKDELVYGCLPEEEEVKIFWAKEHQDV